MPLSYLFLDPWHDFLPREGGHVLSVMGSGGKTSLILALSTLYQSLDIPVILTTTTQSEILPDVPVFEEKELSGRVGASESPDDLPSAFFLSGGLNSSGKWAGISSGMVDELGALFPDRIVLVEVDGSAEMPVKIHKDGEPVWPERTSLALIVMGAAAVGDPVKEVVHRFGRQPSKALESLKEWENLEWDHLQDILQGPGGYLEQVPEGVPAMLILTGMDTQDDSIGLFSFVGQAMENPRVPIVAFCDFGSENGEIRVACHMIGDEPGDESGDKSGNESGNESCNDPADHG